MLRLMVRVIRPGNDEPATYFFSTSPVRLGSNALNDLPLEDPAISAWHGLLQFDDRTVQYMDLSGGEASRVKGEVLRNNTFIPLEQGSDLFIGSLQLQFSRIEPTLSGPARPRSQTLFERRITSDTMLSQPPAPGPVRAESFSEKAWVNATVNALLPRQLKYREAWDKLFRQLNDALASVPLANRGTVLQALQSRLPTLAQESEFAVLLGSPAGTPVQAAGPDRSSFAQGLGAAALAPAPSEPQPGADNDWKGKTLIDVALPAELPARKPAVTSDSEELALGANLLGLFAETYAPGSQRWGSAEFEKFLQQLAAVLEAFAQAFVELRRGQEEFAHHLALPRGGDSALRWDKGSARDVLGQLLRTGPEASARVNDLTRGFADVMVHQVALLSGVRAGVRDLLAGLSPESFTETKPGASGFLNAAVGALTLRPLLAWGKFVKRYRELTDEERAIEGVLFGPAFAFAYTRIIGGTNAATKQQPVSNATASRPAAAPGARPRPDLPAPGTRR